MFLEGSVYKSDFILDEDLVLVTFNYRLGPIGNAIDNIIAHKIAYT